MAPILNTVFCLNFLRFVILTSVSHPQLFQCGSRFGSSILGQWWKILIDLFLGLHKGRLSYARSLKPSKKNIKHFKTWNFLTFSIFVSIVCPPESGPGSSRPKLMRIRKRKTGFNKANNFNWDLNRGSSYYNRCSGSGIPCCWSRSGSESKVIKDPDPT